MDTPFSSISVSPLSSNITPILWKYVHPDRKLKSPTLAGSTFGCTMSSYNWLDHAKDIVFSHNSVNILTDYIGLSSIFSGKTENIVKYYYDSTTEEYNFDTTVKNSYSLHNYYLVTAPISSTLNFTVIPLKNGSGVTTMGGHAQLDREYMSLFFYSSMGADHTDLFTSYKKNYMDLLVPYNKQTNVVVPSGGNVVALSSMGLVELGAIGGSCPANSDLIYLDKLPNTTHHLMNGIPLCMWLSASTPHQDHSTAWMERWYDPTTISHSDAYIAAANTDAFASVVDIPTEASIYPSDSFTIDRYGSKRNDIYIRSLTGVGDMLFDDWSINFKDSIGGIAGYVYGNVTDSSYLNLDGYTHAHIPPTDNLLIPNNLTVGMWAFKDDWTVGVDSQLFGNFSNGEGYGLFYSTGSTSNLITFPTSNGVIYGFNYKGYKVFQKDLTESIDLTGSNITYMVTDFFGARWLYDDNNKKIIKLESDDLIKRIITLPSSAKICKMKINSKNELRILNTYSNKISAFDQTGEWVSTTSVNSKYNNFEIDCSDDVRYVFADEVVSDSKNNLYTIQGSNIYLNNTIYFYVGKQIDHLCLDVYDNIYILYNKNQLLKISNENKVLFNITIPLSFVGNTVNASFVKEISNGIESDMLWVAYSEQRYIIKIDSNGNILKRINLATVVNLKNCSDFALTSLGDFTEYDIKRKYERFDDGSSVSTKVPAFSIKMNVKCGNITSLIQTYYKISRYNGWIHLAFTFENHRNSTLLNLYINGIKYQSTVIGSSIYSIDYGTKVSPFIIGGNSGKLGAKNIERSVLDGYFVGRLDDLRIFHKVLSDFDITMLAKNKYYSDWKDMMIRVPTPTFTTIEQITQFHLNRYAGFKSNKFNLKIKGFDDPLIQERVRSYINSIIDTIKPAHTSLHDIIFV